MRQNRLTSCLLAIMICGLSGCGWLFSSPTSVVKRLITDIQNSDFDAAVSLWSAKAIQEQGADKIRGDAEHFAELDRKARAAGEDPQVQNTRETIQGDRARVFFFYRDSKGRDSVGMGFALLKENGKWKIYRSIDIGEEDQPFDNSFAPKKSANSSESEFADYERGSEEEFKESMRENNGLFVNVAETGDILLNGIDEKDKIASGFDPAPLEKMLRQVFDNRQKNGVEERKVWIIADDVVPKEKVQAIVGAAKSAGANPIKMWDDPALFFFQYPKIHQTASQGANAKGNSNTTTPSSNAPVSGRRAER